MTSTKNKKTPIKLLSASNSTQDRITSEGYYRLRDILDNDLLKFRQNNNNRFLTHIKNIEDNINNFLLMHNFVLNSDKLIIEIKENEKIEIKKLQFPSFVKINAGSTILTDGYSRLGACSKLSSIIDDSLEQYRSDNTKNELYEKIEKFKKQFDDMLVHVVVTNESLEIASLNSQSGLKNSIFEQCINAIKIMDYNGLKDSKGSYRTSKFCKMNKNYVSLGSLRPFIKYFTKFIKSTDNKSELTKHNIAYDFAGTAFRLLCDSFNMFENVNFSNGNEVLDNIYKDILALANKLFNKDLLQFIAKDDSGNIKQLSASARIELCTDIINHNLKKLTYKSQLTNEKIEGFKIHLKSDKTITSISSLNWIEANRLNSLNHSKSKDINTIISLSDYDKLYLLEVEEKEIIKSQNRYDSIETLQNYFNLESDSNLINNQVFCSIQNMIDSLTSDNKNQLASSYQAFRSLMLK